MKKETIGTIEMLICALLWSIAGIFMKLIPWNGFAIAGMRSFIAGLTMLAYVLIKGYKLVVNKKTLCAGLFTGLVYTCFTVANKLTTAANAIVLQFTSPVFIVVFSALIFRQRIRKRDLSVVILTLLGIALFFFDQLKPGYVAGNFVAIAAGLFMALMFIFVGDLEPEARFSAIILGQGLTFLIGLPFIVRYGLVFSPTITASILTLGIFQLGISYILYVKASKYCPPLACCLLGALEPLLNPVWVAIFDGERPGIWALIGGVIVVASITVWLATDKKETSDVQ